MRVLWSWNAWKQFSRHLQDEVDLAVKEDELIRDIARHPFTGLGKPEPLKRLGFWSLRIDREHRLVYRVTGADENKTIEILSCQGHYDD